MPCPFFLPLRVLGPDAWTPAPRLPLNDAWAGECQAGEFFAPPEAEQRSLCNSGYARGACSHFPDNAPADAVRFAFTEAGLIYILEKNHAPVEYGEIEPVRETRPLLTAQARAFTESHAKLPTKEPVKPEKAAPDDQEDD